MKISDMIWNFHVKWSLLGDKNLKKHPGFFGQNFQAFFIVFLAKRVFRFGFINSVCSYFPFGSFMQKNIYKNVSIK